MIPKVDTFEHDISDEIRRKEASLTEISAASNDVGNNNDDIELPKKQPIFMIALAVFFVLSIAGFLILGYFYYTDTQTIGRNTPAASGQDPRTTPPNLEKLSPALANNIGRYVTSVDKKEKGYILAINDYSQVFAYMTRNEKDFINDFAALFQSSTSTNNTPLVKPVIQKEGVAATTQTSSSTTEVSTTTKKSVAVSTSTTEVSATKNTEPLPSQNTINTQQIPEFSDITISNQNIRVWSLGSQKVYYAFIGNKAVVISDSSEGILYLKSAILK